jgi:hypothetical protein
VVGRPFSPSTFHAFSIHASRLLGVRRRQRDPALHLAVERDLEGVLPRPGKRDIEHQDCTGLDVHHSRGRLPELNRPLSPQQLGAVLVHKADPDRMNADLGSPASHPQDQVGPGTDRREVGDPDMLKDAKHTQLALLIDEGIIGDQGKVEMQLRSPGWR